MNLTPHIAELNTTDIVTNYIRSIELDSIRESITYIIFSYRIAHYELEAVITKKISDDTEINHDVYLNELFNTDNDILLYIFNSRNDDRENYISKDNYPVHILGDPSKKFLSLKDSGPYSWRSYTLDSIDVFIEYLCTIYEYDEELFRTTLSY